MKKTVLNYWVDVTIGAAMLVCAATGLVRLFPAAATVTDSGVTILGVSTAFWAAVHDWSGVAVAAGVVLHTLLHLRWLTHMTKKLARGSGSDVARTLPVRSPQDQVGASLAKLAAMGDGNGVAAPAGRPRDDPARMTRRRFLAGAATVGAAAALAGAVLLRESGSETIVASTHDGTMTGDASSSHSASVSAPADASDPSASGSSGDAVASESPAAVSVDAGACIGCGRCLQVCPQGVFTMSEGTAVASNAGACTLCGRCTQVCRPQAITLNG